MNAFLHLMPPFLTFVLGEMTNFYAGPMLILGGGGGILGLIILILDIIAIIQILQGGGDTMKKLLWILVILVLPILGLILWYLLGRK